MINCRCTSVSDSIDVAIMAINDSKELLFEDVSVLEKKFDSVLEALDFIKSKKYRVYTDSCGTFFRCDIKLSCEPEHCIAFRVKLDDFVDYDVKAVG